MTRKTAILLFLLLIAPSTFSQVMQDTVIHLQSVTVTADRMFKKEEAGMKKTSVDSLVMAEKINLSLSELLSENTSIYMKDYGRGALATASFRGTSPTHTQVSWNGITINSPMLGMVDFSLIPVYIVDEIKLQHGGASVSESSGGLGGHISINNTVDWKNRFSGRYYQGIGSFSTFDEFGQINLGNEVLQSKTRIYHNASRNDYSMLNTHIKDTVNEKLSYPVVKNEGADYRKYGVQQELYYRPVQEFFSSARFWFQDADRGIPHVQSFEGSENTYRKNRQNDQTVKAVLDGTYYGKNYQLMMRTGIDYQVLDYVMRIKNSGQEELKPVNSGTSMFSNYNHAGFKLNAGEKLSFKLGADLNYFNISTRDSANTTGYDEKRTEYSVLSGLYLHPLKKLNVLLELRKDWIPHTEAPFIYNIGLSYKPFEKHGLELKSGFVRNFHHPSLNDLYWQPGGNPDLLPEEGHTAELGLHYIGQTGKLMINLEMTGYYSDINNWILWLPSVKGYWEATNLKNVTSRGVEFNLNNSLQVKKLIFDLNGNYAFTKSTSTDPVNELNGTEGNQLPFIPKHSANALAGISLNGFYVRYQYHFYGIRNLMNSNFEQPEDQFPYYRLYAHHLSSLSLGKDFFLKHVKLGTELKIGNLFNESYRNVLNRFMPGRSFTFLLKVSF